MSAMEDYKVIRAIGKGSFGKVYLVKNTKDNRQYVMKVIKLKGIPPKEREACRNEVMLMKRLAHPNIVAYKDSFFANGQDNLCIVMTYCDGGDLSARLAAAGGQLFKEDQIMHWFVQIALAIHYMHENKVLHRDIKTQNVFLLGNGRLVLGDLGISKVLDGTVQFASTQIGTPYYMSPELFKNKPYNHKSDVWALGCVLYELCTLHHPFDAQSLQGLAAKIGRGSFAPISAKYSQALHALVKSMLALEPRQRPSVAEVLTQPYLKKHIYNFLKDIAERAALGLGSAPPKQVMAGKVPISEGTMMFKAAAQNVAGSGQSSGQDAAAHAAAAGLGPHASNMQAQLVALGLKEVAAQALTDAVRSSQAAGKEDVPPSSSVQAAPLKPAFALANLNQAPAPIASGAGAAPKPPLAARPSISSSGAPAVAAPAPSPAVLGPDGRALSPSRARRYLKEQQAALQREEERKKAVELALSRLKQERDLREKGREDLRRKQEARLSGAGLPPSRAGAASSVQAGAGAPLSAALPSSQAAVRAYLLGQNPTGAGIAALPPKSAGSVPAYAGLPPRSGAAPASGARQPSPGPASSAQAAAQAYMLAQQGKGAGAISVVGSSAPSGSAPGSRSSSAGQGAGSRPTSSGGSGTDRDRAELKERAEKLARDAKAVEAARNARAAGVAAPVSGSAGPSSRASSNSSAGAAAARPSVSSSDSRLEKERSRVADLDAWEREKGMVGAAGRVMAAGKGAAVPIGVSALQAAAAAQGVQPLAVPQASSVQAQAASVHSNSRAPTAPVLAPSVANKLVGRSGSAGDIPPGRVSTAASVSSSVSVAPSEGPANAAGQVVLGRPAGAPQSEPGLRVAAPAGASSRSAGPSPVPAPSSSRAPSPSTAAVSSASEEDAAARLSDARARVMALKEARKRAEEEMQRKLLEDAAREGAIERKRAAFLTREAYRGVGAAMAGGPAMPAAVLDASLEEAQDLVQTLSQGLSGAARAVDESKSVDVLEDGELPSASRYQARPASTAGSGAPAHLPQQQQQAGKPAVLLGRDGLPLDYVPAPVPEDAVGANTRRGELPADLEEDSEDEVWLETGQTVGQGSEGAGKPSVAADGRSSAVSPLRSPPALAEDDDDIGETEQALQAELARSTMRCAELRQSLVVARKVAVTVGVPLPSASKARRTSSVSNASVVPVVSTGGAALSLPPAAYRSAPLSVHGTPAGRPTIVDDRPIRPAAASAASAVILGPSSELTTSGKSVLPPRSGGVLAPSAAATAAAGGYLGTGGSRGPSPGPSARRQSPTPAVASVSASAVATALVASGSGGSTPKAAAEAAQEEQEAGEDGAPPPAPAMEEELEAEDADADEEAYEDEDELGDEDGDAEGQVVFPTKPRGGAMGRTPAGKLHSATIREEDEDEYAEEEEEEEDGPFGDDFKARLGLASDGTTGGSAGCAETSVPAGGAGAIAGTSASAPGGLLSRIEELRQGCSRMLGARLFEQVYAAVRDIVGDNGSESANPGGDPDQDVQEVSQVPARFGLTQQQAAVVQDIVYLLQMESDL